MLLDDVLMLLAELVTLDELTDWLEAELVMLDELLLGLELLLLDDPL